MAELADAGDLKSPGETRTGSSPVPGTSRAGLGLPSGVIAGIIEMEMQESTRYMIAINCPLGG